jgi:predicted branched-subunit amino acid permease
MKSRNHLLLGVVDALPICVSFFFVFSAVGALCRDSGFTAIATAVGTAAIFAAPLQALIANKMAGVALLALIGMTVITNFRFALMSAALAPHFSGLSRIKKYMSMILLSASTYAVTQAGLNSRADIPSEEKFAYYLGVSIPSYLVAIAASVIGYDFMSFGNSPYLHHLFLAVLPMHFASLTAKRKSDAKVLLCTVLGMALTPVIVRYRGLGLDLIVPLGIGAIAAHAAQSKLKRQASK